MYFFKKRREKRINKILEDIKKKNRLSHYVMLVFGCLVVAFAFNLFFLKYNIVCFGVSGIAIVLSKFGVNASNFIMIANLILLVIGYFILGPEEVKNQLVGSLLYPIFISLTLPIANLIDLGGLEMIVIAVLGGVSAGIGYGFIYKSGYSTGGTDVICSIICHYFKISMGTGMMFINYTILIIGKLVFPWETVMYAVIVAYLISFATDRILLGISNSKAFYIVVDKDKDLLVRDFLNSLSGVGSTIIDASGGYSNERETLILAVVPTKDYFLIKEGLREIDKNIFYLVCDSYEVSSNGGK